MTPARKYILPALWLLVAVSGIAWLARAASLPGPREVTPTTWPEKSAVARTGKTLTLLMFAHPRCPCTRASIENLNRLLAKCPSAMQTTVLFISPSSEDEAWARTDSWRSAANIPGVTVQADRDGQEAARFGAETSGYVALYSSEGKLLFAGGITQSRGHAGDNEGGESILQLVSEQTTTKSTSPVFGCELGKSFCRKL